jgi:hypothetical protein
LLDKLIIPKEEVQAYLFYFSNRALLIAEVIIGTVGFHVKVNFLDGIRIR